MSYSFLVGRSFIGTVENSVVILGNIRCGGFIRCTIYVQQTCRYVIFGEEHIFYQQFLRLAFNLI